MHPAAAAHCRSLSGLVVNEFTSPDWSQPLAPGCSVGQAALAIRCARCRSCGLLAPDCVGGASKQPAAARRAPAAPRRAHYSPTRLPGPPWRSGFPTSYSFVWIAIFATGLGCAALNFGAGVACLAKLEGGFLHVLTCRPRPCVGP